jgi:nickel-dependent lactate racemase
MTTTVQFGAGESFDLAIENLTLLAPNAEGRSQVDDPAAAIRAALAAPLGYPPLKAALVPGDQVTVAVGKGVPGVASLLRGAVAELVDAGIEPANVTVLSAEATDEISRVAAELGVQTNVHRPDDADGLAMVGVTATGEPLRLNRSLVEADFVLPISRARSGAGNGDAPKFAGLYPQFSSRAAVEKFHDRGKAAPAQRRAERAAEADDAGRKLGVALTVGVVPGVGGGVAGIVAGDPGQVARAAAEQFRAIWERATERPADLVIAAVAGDAQQQTWTNFARAVAAAERVLRPDGAIAICSELETPPGGSFERLRDAVDYAAVARGLGKARDEEARSAKILAEALERGPVYLHSRLPADVVESLGMTPIESGAELSRLAAGRGHCVVIEEAQRVRPRLAGGGHGVE